MKQRINKSIQFLLAFGLVIVLAACGQDVSVPPDQSNETQGSADTEQGTDQTGEQAENEDANKRKNEKEPLISQAITVYYVDTQLLNMTEEKREAAYTVEGQQWLAIWNLLQTPQEADHVSLWKDVVLLDTELQEGILTLDLTGIDAVNVGSAGEAYALQAVLQTYGQVDGVKYVQFMVDGTVRETLFGHISTDEPLLVDQPLLQ